MDAFLAATLRYGRDAVAFAGLKSELERFGAAIAYKDTGRAWVTAGSPLALDRNDVAHDIVAAARGVRRRVVFCGVEAPLGTGFRSLVIGAQPIWRPSEWQRPKQQLARARNKGLTVRPLAPHELSSRRPQLEALRQAWLREHSAPPLGFVAAPDPFCAPEHRRYVIAEHAGAIVGFLSAAPRGSGFVFEDIWRTATAPNGTSESLIDAAFELCKDADDVTLGLVALAGQTPWWLRGLARFGRHLYDARGIRAFRERLAPSGWQPVYLAWPRSSLLPTVLLDTLDALTGGFRRYALAARPRDARPHDSGEERPCLSIA